MTLNPYCINQIRVSGNHRPSSPALGLLPLVEKQGIAAVA
jgi:hypothetical protein